MLAKVYKVHRFTQIRKDFYYFRRMKIKLLISLLILLHFGYSQGIEFEENNWEDVLTKAVEIQKPIFVDVYTTWCKPCKLMSSQVFNIKEVGDVYNANFICCKVDAEKGDGIRIAKEYEVNAFPTYLFLNANGTLVMKAKGSMSPEEFLTLALSAKNELSNPKSIVEWENEYVQKKTDTAFLRAYMEKNTHLGKSNTKLFDEYLALLPDDQRVSKEIINMYYEEINHIKIHTLAYENLQRNQSKFYKLGTNIYIFILHATENSLREAIKNGDERLLEDVVEENEKIPKIINLKRKEEIYMDYYKSLNDEENYIRNATAYCETWLMSKDIAPVLREIYSENLNNIAWNFFERITDLNALKNALRWSKRSLEFFPDNYMYLDTYARLLYKLGKINKAIAMQKKAIKLVKNTKDEENIAKYEEILQKMKQREKKL